VIAANDQVHPVPRRHLAKSIQHSFHSFRQNLLLFGLIDSAPIQQAQRILRQTQHVTFLCARAIDDGLQFCEVAVHLLQDRIRFKTKINDPCL